MPTIPRRDLARELARANSVWSQGYLVDVRDDRPASDTSASILCAILSPKGMALFRRHRYEVECDKCAIRFLKDESIVWTCRWQDVVRVVAFQTDNFTIDTQWLRIEGCDVPIEISEDTEGFKSLIEGLAACLDIDPEWRSKLGATAFDRNETLVYLRTR